MYKPTLRQIEYFISLSKTLSFSQSAKDCLVNQSTLSSAIKELEDGIGFNLFDRTSRRVFLTTQGELFLEQAQTIVDAQDDLLSKIEHINAPTTKHVRLGVIPTIAPFMLPDILNCPMEFTIREGLSSQVLHDLEERTVDLALIALPYPLKNHFQTIELFKDELYLAQPKEKNGSDNPPFILLEDGHCLRDQAIASCDISHSVISKQFTGTSLHSVLSLVENGMGQTLVPQMSLRFFENIHDIDFTSTRHKKPYRSIALVWSQNKHKDIAHELAETLTNQNT